MVHLLGLLDPEDAGVTLFRNVGSCVEIDTS